MSDMIDRLSDVATEAGEHAKLATLDVTSQLASRIRRGARRRRAIAASVAGAVVLLAGAAAVVVPQLMAPAPLPPAGDARVPVETNEGLITYDDGSMKVLTHDGRTVDVPPAAIGAPAFVAQGSDAACAVDVTTLKPGWNPEFPDAFQFVTFARPLLRDESGYHILPQGERLVHDERAHEPQFAFSADVDPAIAPYVVMTMNSYWLAPDGRVAYYASQLESRPSVEYSGDKAAGTYTAAVTTRTLGGAGECADAAGSADWTKASGIVRYLVVTAFLNDGHGHVNPIATHTSWITIVKEGQ